jgi:endonuclease/exonuclease/phosphatase family metal-dependent hydrolase
MRNLFHLPRSICGILLAALSISNLAGQTNTTVRIMSANLNGDTQSYQPFAIRIFQGLKPDIVAIQEFNYSNNTPADIRSMVDAAFGTNYSYFRETISGYSIPNGIISRYPILASGSWLDTVQSQPNRGYAWARIAVPSTNDLYVVSVHLLTSSSTVRASEASNLKALMQANFPSNAWVVLAGDFNTGSRTEAAMSTFGTYLSDNPIPTDAEVGGNSNTSANRSKPHDYVLSSFSFTNLMTSSVFTSHSFSNGLVFDSRVYTPLGDVAPVLQADSGNAQHMAVLKDFRIAFAAGNTDAPAITTQPQSQAVNQGSNVTFSVTATGTNLTYQWRLAGTNISGATDTTYTRSNVQPADAGNYSVVITNAAGTATSANAVLTVGGVPIITTQPQNQTVFAAQTAIFSVGVGGATPLGYQWRSSSGDISGATASSYTLTNAQTTDAGNYSVVISNYVGSVTSAPANLTVLTLAPSVIAQWNFNSTSPDTNTATGSTTPSAGSGTASVVGGVSPAFFSGSTIDPANSGTDNSGWSAVTFPAQGSGNKAAGFRFNVSTAGRQNISVRYDLRASNTGSKYVRLQYSTDGNNFVDFPTATAINTATVFEPKTNNLASFSAVSDNPNFAFRIVAEFESTAASTSNQGYDGALSGTTNGYAPSGTLRLDMVTISGTIIPTPVNITTQPQSLTVTQGANATFSVAASGTDPLSYQWWFGTNAIAGATNSTYTRNNSQQADAGSYFVIVTNIAGSTNSAIATLTVLVPPSISLQPQDQAVNQGADATFSVAATGSEPLSYQWQRNSTSIPGATENSYTRPSVQLADTGNYSVLVTNSAGFVLSSNALLNLFVPTPTLVMSAPGLIEWQGLSNFSYTVQGKTNIDDTNWTTLGTASSPTVDISFTNQPDAAQQFYRVTVP